MRVRKGSARRRAKKRLLKEVRGNFGARGKLIRTVKETILRSHAFAFRDRRTRKRNMRALWVTRVSAACQGRDISYSQFIHGMKLAHVELNRKSLSELAIFNPAVFEELVQIAKAELSASSASSAA